MDIIKQVKIPVKNIPAVGIDNKYLIRYRIVSDDKNRVSHWSPIYKVSVPYITKAVTNIVANGTTVTYTTASPHDFKVGDIVSIADTNPTAYSYYGVAVSAVSSTTQFSVAKTDTGSYVSGGRVNSGTQILKSLSVSGKAATLTWTLPSTIVTNSFDIYASFKTTSSPTVWGEYTYQSTTASNNFSMVVSDEVTEVRFMVSAATDTKLVSPGAIIFYSAESTI